MLLQRLVEYAESRSDAVPRFHREQEFKWQLDLTRDGRPSGSRLLALEAPEGKERGVRHATPSSTRTAGVAPNLAADDIQYVLGWVEPKAKPGAKPGAKPDRVAKCHEAFVDLTRQWAQSDQAKDDLDVQAVVAFYDRPGGYSIVQPEDFSAKDRVLISVEGRMLYKRSSVVPFWAAEVARRKSGGQVGLCLVCGTVAPLLDTVPGKIPARLLPGASNDAALVSINASVFGYDLSMQLSQCPICLGCGEAISAGLLSILEAHSTSHGGQDSHMAWWIVGETKFNAMELLDRPDPAEVAEFLGRVRSGQPSNTEPGGKLIGDKEEPRFHSLTVGGNVARVMVRDWVEMPLADLEDRAWKWFKNHEVVPTSRDGHRHHSLYRLTLACGRWDRQRNRYADLGTPAADRPPDTRRRLHAAATQGAPLPNALLIHLLHRIATDGHLDDARAALVRLCLTRHPLTSPERVPMPDLDPTASDPAYVAGRVFAVLEQIQYDSSGGKLNTTFGDRYFAGALTSPRMAIVAGRKDAAAWLKKLRRQRPGVAVNHEKRLSAILALMSQGDDLPSRCNPRQQGRFVLGYHHERAEHFAGVRSRADQRAGEVTNDVPIIENTTEENDR
jgi:CRISPR-associated protein Csd1